jgi:hypothetical protein
MEEENLDIKEFEIEKIPLSCTMIIIGAPRSGKGTFMENVMYRNRHRIPIAKMFTGSETQYERFKRITHPLYCGNYYQEEEEKRYILRQRNCALEGGEYMNSINIIDDAGDDPKIFKSKLFLGLFKIGTQHWNHVFMLANQYAIDIPPSIRKAVTYAVLFREPNDIERQKLYKNFGGICAPYEKFCALMNDLTGDYNCLIIQQGSQSNKVEECVFWYRTEPMEPDWKFGCDEYQKWAKDRYDPAYREKVVM